MNTKGYSVRWRNQTYYLSELTIQVKDDFCAWLVRREIANANRLLEANEAMRTRRMILANPPMWTSVADEDVAAALATKAGQLQLQRLLFAFTEDEMTDGELEELMRDKDAEPGSDYQIAIEAILEKENPKAKAVGDSSPAATEGKDLTERSESSHSENTPTSTAA